jgi:hypothetical protein
MARSTPPVRSGFPRSDPFEPHQPGIDITRQGNRDRGGAPRNTGRAPDPKDGERNSSGGMESDRKRAPPGIGRGAS